MTHWVNKATRTSQAITQAMDSPSQQGDLLRQAQVKVKYLYCTTHFERFSAHYLFT